MPVSPAELAAAQKTIRAFIALKVPSWLRHWITDTEISEFATSMVEAIDGAREQPKKDT